MKTIFQSAEECWPEDEAGQIAEFWGDSVTRADYGDEWEAKVKKDCAHMEKVFSAESDAAQLISRFRAAILLRLGVAL